MNHKAIFLAVIVFALVVMLPSANEVVAQGPSSTGGTISYSGRLNNVAGRSVSDGMYAFTFALYDAEKDGNLLWSETQTAISVKGGAFTARLGSVAPFPKEARISQGWLSVSVRGPGETNFTTLLPRQEFSTALAASPSSPTTGAACPHTHLAESWDGDTTANPPIWAGLSVVSTTDGGTGLYGAANNGIDAWGVDGVSTYGIGVRGYSTVGVALDAEGNGVIKSTADSTMWLSPHSMIIRDSDNLVILPGQNGEMTIYNVEGTEDKYLSIPVSALGVLFGTPIRVKSLNVCYVAGSSAKIRATAVTKNDGGTGYIDYLKEVTDRNSTTRTCYTVNASSPFKPIDNSTWVQFNIAFTDNSSNARVIIYSVALTLSELSN